MNRYAIGNNIYRLLKQRHMTQRELAKRIGTHEDTLSRWINGQRQPSAFALLRISRVLGVSMEELMAGVDEKR